MAVVPARRSAAKIAFGCGAVPARRNGARGGLYKLDESHATRWLGFFVFINVSSGSFRWIRGSHEPNDPRERKRRTRRRVPAGKHSSDRFPSSPLFSVPSGAGYGQTNRAVRYAESYRIARFGFLLLSFPVLRKESSYGRGSAPLHPRQRALGPLDSLWLPR